MKFSKTYSCICTYFLWSTSCYFEISEIIHLKNHQLTTFYIILLWRMTTFLHHVHHVAKINTVAYQSARTYSKQYFCVIKFKLNCKNTSVIKQTYFKYLPLFCHFEKYTCISITFIYKIWYYQTHNDNASTTIGLNQPHSKFTIHHLKSIQTTTFFLCTLIN